MHLLKIPVTNRSKNSIFKKSNAFFKIMCDYLAELLYRCIYILKLLFDDNKNATNLSSTTSKPLPQTLFTALQSFYLHDC